MTTEKSKRIHELEILIRDIESSYAWQIAMKELKSRADELDELWQHAKDMDLYKMQVTKVALESVIHIVDLWKEDLEELKEELHAEENPEKVQNGDYDGETLIEE